MMRWLACVIVCVSTWLVSGAVAAAALTWTVIGGTFADGGTVSGTFEQNPLRPRPSTWDLTVAGGGSSFPARSYTPFNSRVEKLLWSPNTQETYRFKATNEGSRELRLTPASPLDGSLTIVPLSFLTDLGAIECFNCGPSRLITSGSLQLASVTPTLILISVAPDPTTPAASITATVSIDSIGAYGPSTGTVTVLDTSNNPVCTITLPATSCTFAAPATPGGHTLRARYNGDTNYESTVSNSLSFTVAPAQATTVTFVSIVPEPTLVGQTTTATVLVEPIAALGQPTGTVTVIDSFNQEFCTITLPATSCTFAPTIQSTATVVAHYSGDASYASVTSNSLPLRVGPVDSSVSVSVTPNPTVVGQATTATVSVALSSVFPPPTGEVTVFEGSFNVLCTATLPATSCTFAPAAPGNLAVAALYNGDANYEGSVSSAQPVVVVGITSATPPDGSVGSAYSHTYTANTSLTYTLTAGALPPGLALANNGLLSGTPTVAGPFTGTVTGTVGSVTTSQAFSITIVMNASVPGAPTIGSATAGNAQATVAFTPPTANGGLPVTSYTATCGAFSAAGASSPLIVTGLTNGIAYSCVVTATNAVGTGPASAAASVTPIGPAIGPGEAVQVPTLSQWAIILLALLLGFAALAFRPRC